METVEATAVEIVAATAANDGENGAVMTVEESSVDNSSWMKSGSAAAPGEPAMAEPSFPTEETGMSTAVASMIPEAEQEQQLEPRTVTVTQTLTGTVTAVAETVASVTSVPGEQQDQQEEPTKKTTTVVATKVESGAVASIPYDQEAAETEEHYPTEETGERSAKSPETSEEPATSEGGASAGGSGWMTGLMLTVGCGDGDVAEKSATVSVEQEPAAEVAAGGVPATQSLTDAGFPTEGEGGDIDGGKVGEGPGVAEGRGVVIPGFPTEETNGGTGGSVVEAGFPTEEEAGGIERADGAAATKTSTGDDEADGGGATFDGELLDKRKDAIAAEMEAFLEDSEAEDGGAQDGNIDQAGADAGAGGSEADPAAPESGGGVTSEPVSVRKPEDTEFSATHAKKVIGAGVVLQRKASIKSVAPELKNKSDFSKEDAAAKIEKGAISERTRRLKEEQEALNAKHATERQDTDLPVISSDMNLKGSVKGKARMYHQAIEDVVGEKAVRSAPAPRRLNTDWTKRRESLEEFVVKYEPPPMPAGANSTATGGADGPARYIPLPSTTPIVPNSRSRGGSAGSTISGVAASEQSRASGIGQEETAAGAAVNSGGEVVVGEMSVEAGSALGGDTATKGGSQVMAGNPPETEGQGNEVGVSNDLASPSGNDSALPSARGVDAENGATSAASGKADGITEFPSNIAVTTSQPPAVKAGGGCCVIS